MTSNWDELCQAEELAYFKGDMVLDSPESYTAEEMWDVVMEMFGATIAVQDAMHEDFMSHTPEERQALLDACVGSGTASEDWWKNTLLGYEEMPDYPAQITGEMGAGIIDKEPHSVEESRAPKTECLLGRMGLESAVENVEAVGCRVILRDDGSCAVRPPCESYRKKASHSRCAAIHSPTARPLLVGIIKQCLPNATMQLQVLVAVVSSSSLECQGGC